MASSIPDSYRRLAEAVADPLIVDLGGRIVYANPRFLAWVGAGGPDEVVNRPALDFVHPSSRADAEGARQRLQSTGQAQPLDDLRWLRLDGTTVEATSVVSLLPMESATAVQTILETNAASPVALTLSETLDHLIEGFQIVGRDWRYIYVNPAAARHGRRQPDELHGRTMWEAYPGIDETPIFDVLRRCMSQGQTASLENQFTFPDGSTRWFEVRVEPIPEGVCIHSVDIQDRKDADAALREQESVARLGRMAAVVAHEVKNPLAGLYGALQVLRARRQPPDPEAALFDQMMDRIRSLNRLIQDLLVFAKPMQLQPRPVAIGDVLHDARLLLETDPDVQRHAVEVSSGEPTPILIAADRELLRLVLQNLLLNAAQAMRRAGTIAVGVTRRGSVCEVTVTDTGGGVAPEIAHRIFEPFVTTRNGGTGLGLAVSRRIARLHGGDLDFSVSPGTGTTFRLTLPLLDN